MQAINKNNSTRRKYVKNKTLYHNCRILALKRRHIQITVKSVYLLLLDFYEELKVTEKSATTQCGVTK